MKIRVPKFLRRLFPSLIWEIEDDCGVYLTFDDGPTPEVTEWILETLKQYNAKATFFVLGKNVELYPDLYAKILSEGHAVGNHTYSHQRGVKMSREHYLEDVATAANLVHSNLFRVPYARATLAQIRSLAQQYKIVMWSIVSHDYNRHLTPRRVLRNVIAEIKAGSIVVFHDSDKAFRNMSYALIHTLEYVKQQGWRCKIIEL